MTERFNANAQDTITVSNSGGPPGTGLDLTTLGVGQGSGQTASRQENNASIGFEFPIRWDDVASSLGRLGEKKYLGEFVDDMEMRDKMVEDYLTTSVVNGIVGQNGVAINKSQGVVTASISATYLQLLVPVGTIHPYGGTTAPYGWLLCDGGTTVSYPILSALVGATTPNIKGKVIVGVDSGDPDFSTPITSTGGLKSVTLTGAQSGVPVHGHGITSQSFSGTAGTVGNTSLTHSHTGTTVSEGEHTHNTDTSSGPSATHGHNILDRLAHGPSNQNVTYTAGCLSTEPDHSHTFTTASALGDHDHSFTPAGSVSVVVASNTAADASSAHTNLQPYMALNYIIKHDY